MKQGAPEQNNFDRAAAAGRALALYDDANLTDLLADLMHYAGEDGFRQALDAAWRHYYAEVAQ